MNEFKLSILITFYNQIEYVDRLLNSIFSQETKYEYEIIVGDDGSNDGTYERLEEWQKEKKNIRIYRFDRNGTAITGFRASRNRLFLLSKASGKYSLFFDGDDFICDNNKLEKQISILEKYDDCFGCAHNFYYYKSDSDKRLGVNRNLKEGKVDVYRYWRDLYFHTDTLVFRTCIRESMDVSRLENQFNDNMITYMVIQNAPIYYLEEPMICYYLTGDGIWTGEKQIISNIRNIYLYDLCISINHKFKKQTRIKLFHSWKFLFKVRKEINIENDEFLKEAHDKGFFFSEQWIQFNTLTIKNKMRLYIEYLHCFVLFQLSRIRKLIRG